MQLLVLSNEYGVTGQQLQASTFNSRRANCLGRSFQHKDCLICTGMQQCEFVCKLHKKYSHDVADLWCMLL